jgi:hypothetical protein
LQLDKSAEKDWADGENLSPVIFDTTEPMLTPLAQLQKRLNTTTTLFWITPNPSTQSKDEDPTTAPANPAIPEQNINNQYTRLA